MGNAKNTKLIRIYGVTIGNGRRRPYGHGRKTIEDVAVDYVDFFIEDLVALIKNQELEKAFLEGLKEA